MTTDDSVNNEIVRAVEAALDAGWQPRQFMLAASECWDVVLADRRRDAGREWNRLLAPRVVG